MRREAWGAVRHPLVCLIVPHMLICIVRTVTHGAMRTPRRVWRRAALGALLAFLMIPLLAETSAQAFWEVNIVGVNFVSQANGPVYPGSTMAELRVDVLFLVNATRPSATIAALPPGISPSYGYGYTTQARGPEGAPTYYVRAGETASFAFRLNVDRSVEPGTKLINLQVTFEGDDGVVRRYHMWVLVSISPYPPLELRLAETWWSPAGYPATFGASLQLVLENLGDSDVAYAFIELSCPRELVCERSHVTLSNLRSGYRTVVTIPGVHIPEGVSPGSLPFSLKVNATLASRDGVTYNNSTELTFTVDVERAPDRLKQLRLLNVYWGVERPQPTYEDALYAQVSFELVNRGPRPVTSLEAELGSESARVIKGGESSVAYLDVGGAAVLTFYVSLEPQRLLGGSLPLELNLRYTVDLGEGAYTVVKDSFSVTLDVERYAKEERGTSLIDHGWQNGYAVYPMTQGATLAVTLSNNLPYSLSGINLTLLLPEGFSSNGERQARVYIGSPLQAYGALTASFRIDVGDVEPGDYEALLLVDYVANVGGPGKRMTDVHALRLSVSSLSEAFELIVLGWEGSGPDVGTYGAGYIIAVRNVGVDAIRFPVLWLSLPEGLALSYTNSSVGGVLPRVSGTRPALQAPEWLGQMPTVPLPSQQEVQVQTGLISRGETVTFVVPLNVLVKTPGLYIANATLSFVDHWGNVRQYEMSIPVVVLGSSKYVDVAIFGGLDARGRYTNATLVVTNLGSSSVYNAYVTLQPPTTVIGGQQATLMIVTPSTLYFDELKPGEPLRVPLTMVFNPLALQAQYGVAGLVSIGVVPIDVTITFKDATGSQRTFKYQIAIPVEPFVDPRVSEVRALLSGDTVRVSGTITNYGSSTAYRLSARACIANVCSTMFVGDVEPGGTAAFRVDLRAEQQPSVVLLIIGFYNVYNELVEKELTVPVEVQAPTPTTATATMGRPAPIPAPGAAVTLALVAVFVVVAALLIYRMYRAHLRRLEIERGVGT